MGNFGDLLKLYRLTSGMTQKDLADKIGVSYQAISRLERSAGVPNYSTIERLADALGLSPMALIDIHDGLSTRQETENNVQPELIKVCNTLNVSGQNKVIEYAKDLSKIAKYQAAPPEPAEE